MTNDTTKIALFGTNSTHKTLQIRTLIEWLGAENVGIINCEAGLSTIGSSLNEQHVQRPTKLSQFEEALRWAERYQGEAKFLCIDGGTRVLQWNAGKIWDASDEAYDQMVFLKRQRSSLEGVARYGSRFITGQGEIDGYAQWKEIGVQAEILLNKILATGCNVYMNFWEDESQLPDRKKGLPWGVDAPGKASRDAVYNAFDYILRLTVEGGRCTAMHDESKQYVRSKARNDLKAGIVVPREQKDFSLAQFVQSLKPQPAAMETK
jgi:hypothetical protein